jgi:hypothetical protein
MVVVVVVITKVVMLAGDNCRHEARFGAKFYELCGVFE